MGGLVAFIVVFFVVSLCNTVFGALMGVGRLDTYSLNTLFTTGIACAVWIAYAAKFYPSYFGEKPRLRSSRLISLCNFAFGGPLFGALWNRNLTRRIKEISHIVFVILLALLLLAVAVDVVAPSLVEPSLAGQPSADGFGKSGNGFGEYTSGDGSFSVLAPKKPEETTELVSRADGSKYRWTRISAWTSHSQMLVHYLDSEGFGFDEEDLVSETNRFIQSEGADADSTKVVRGQTQGFPSTTAAFVDKGGRYSSFTGVLKDGDIYLMCGFGRTPEVADELNASFKLSTPKQ